MVHQYTIKENIRNKFITLTDEISTDLESILSRHQHTTKSKNHIQRQYQNHFSWDTLVHNTRPVVGRRI